jgi:hypothetical protein
MERSRRNLAACGEEFGGVRVGELVSELGVWRAAMVAGERLPGHPKIVTAE